MPPTEFERETPALPDGRAQAGRPAPRDDSVALLFRRERIVRMRRLSEIADHLKVREFYLQAIEDGAFEDLPEGTYAVGFVRAYADYLGLDSDGIVARFKSERARTDQRPSVQPEAFRPAKPKAQIPSGAVLLVSLLLVASTYAGWWYRSGNAETLAQWDLEAPAPSLSVARE